MDIRFKDTQPANASAETLFEVIIDYSGYPRFNPAVVEITVVERHQNSAELTARRSSGMLEHATGTHARHFPVSQGILMKPLLKRIFYGINFKPFIEDAERRTLDRVADHKHRSMISSA
jgi:ribosome-associated toxin RatA of RatAB toxin-antitoxin module